MIPVPFRFGRRSGKNFGEVFYSTSSTEEEHIAKKVEESSVVQPGLLLRRLFTSSTWLSQKARQRDRIAPGSFGTEVSGQTEQSPLQY
jgi:hypothetical protein